ncbi:YfiR family protein [Montanilutibacter psychrotolerans]|uniref:YfiR family protein n=1 Tax=Montanilutibacter psychrotolerans TaxID=1327343 RepID=A0A3M8SZ71_9GAMM|nr:YfiR family protein [Lysobacter psychrotolerans]RNF86123.1 YfiR family protein [Lysobacter psychrotolerans]
MVVLNAAPPRSAIARLAALLALALLMLIAFLDATAAELQASEYRVKAAFVYKFGDYVEWPAEAFAGPSAPITIGVVGADALADELARISAGRVLAGRPVVVRKLRHGDSLAGMHVVFIGRAEGRQLATALDATKGRAALTVTESSEGFRLGSMVNFVVVADKVRFDVALRPAEASRLKISSRLLAVARTVVAPP